MTQWGRDREFKVRLSPTATAALLTMAQAAPGPLPGSETQCLISGEQLKASPRTKRNHARALLQIEQLQRFVPADRSNSAS